MTTTNDMQPTEPREPTKDELQKEIARIDRSITDILFFGGTAGLQLLLNGDTVLRTRGKGLEIYADLVRDGHTFSQIRKRKTAVTAREWAVTPASEEAIDAEIAELVKNVLTRLRFDKLTTKLLDSILKGFAIGELIWSVVDGAEYGFPGRQFTVPVKFKKRNQKRFIADITGNFRLQTKENPLVGEELPDRKFIAHTSGDEDDDSPYGRGVGHAIFWPVFFKRQTLSFWNIFNDKFGAPTAKGTYPNGTLEPEQQKLRNTLDGISRAASIIIPDGMIVELMEAAKGTTDSYQRMCEYMDAEISKAVLGETLTTSVGENGGNRALGEVHNDVRMELAKNDADDLSYTLNETLLKWIVEYNYPGRMPPTVWRQFEEQEDLDKIVDRDVKLKELGYRRSEESFTETYGEGYERAPEPVPPDPLAVDVPQFAETKPTIGARILSLLSRRRNVIEKQKEKNRENQATFAEGANQLSGNWETLVGPRVHELLATLDETKDLAAFRESLHEMIDAKPSEELVESIARATFSAHLSARMPRGK